ncbi:hypothetical protein BGZ81_001800 [Podila clonocystis]|nr:hypothetical protein BGZ81_001800 [Podila clonocystis]
MEVESAILFNVNPPSPQGSDYYSDEQDTILRTWHAGDSRLVEQSQYSHSMPHHLAEKGYCGIITPYEYAASFDPDSINTLDRNPTQPTDMSFSSSKCPDQDRRSSIPVRGSLSSDYHASEDFNAPPGYPRKGQSPTLGRRGPGESNRKSELYKTELCISLTTGNPCRYGDQCQFAHSKEELQHVNRHPRYKTQFCMSFQAHGYCKYNERCTFIHHPEEARVPLASIPDFQGNAEGGTSTPTPESTSSAKGPRADRTRALSDPGFASASSAAGALADGEPDSCPYHEPRRRSNVSYPPDLLYKLAHPQMAQFTEREHTVSAFPLAMERESMMVRENIMRENLAMARESMRESMRGNMVNVPSVESIMVPLGAMNLSTILDAPQLIPQLQVPTVTQVQPRQVQVPKVQDTQVQTLQVRVPQVEAPQVQAPHVQVPQTQAPQTQAPQTQAPQTQAPQVHAAQIQVPPPQVLPQVSATVLPGFYPPMVPTEHRVSPTVDSDEVDEQWARAMAAYISTSDNEFEM